MSRPVMPNLTYKIIVLLQSLKYASQILPPSYLSTYWQSTYVSDKVPDYWNHGAIYVPGLKETKKVEIFPAWLTKTSTESSSQVTETTPMEDYEIEIFKPPTDNVSSVNSAEIEKNTGKLRADLVEDTTTTPMPQTELTSAVASVLLTRTSGTKTNSKIADNLTKTASTSEKNYFTRLEYETTIDDYKTHSTFTTIIPSVSTSTEESKSNSIIMDSIFTKIAPKPEKNDFTRPEHETMIHDFVAHRPSPSSRLIISSEKPKSNSIAIDSIFTKRAPTPEKNAFTRPESETTIVDFETYRPSLSSSAISSSESKLNSIITDSISTKTTPTPEKKAFTRPEFETPIEDYDTPPSFSTMNPSVKTSPKSNSIITDDMFKTAAQPPYKNVFTRPAFETTIDDDGVQPVSATTAIPSTTPYETTFDYVGNPNSTPMTHQTPEYDSDAHPKCTRITQQISTPEYDKTSNDYDATNYDYETTKPTQEDLSTTTTLKLSSTKADLEPMIRAVNKEIPTDPFTVFLRKLMIVLSTKRLEDLPLLIDQFREYLWMLLTGGQIGKMGFYINSFLAQQVILLDKLPAGVLRNYFNKFQKMLANRDKVIPKDINDILDYMDDTYDEAEEEAMQAVLYEITRYPNTENKNKIAQGFVDFVFLNPMQRVMGTTRGKVLFGMMTEALKKRQPSKEDRTRVPAYIGFRKNFKVGKKHLSDKNGDKESTLDKSYKIKNEDREAKSDSSSDTLGENSNVIRNFDDIDEHSDGTENKKTIESKYNKNIVTRNVRQHRLFNNVNRVTMRSRKIRKPLTRQTILRHSVKNRQRILNDYVEIRGNAFSHKHLRKTTAISANFLETTDSGNIEMELKAKIYDTLRRMNLVNYNASRRMRQGIKSTVDVLDDSQETDVERVLKNNIYKAVKKLLN